MAPVLAAETAIGAYPTRCASMIVRMVREFEARRDGETPLPEDADTSLIPPHGGILIERTAETADPEDFSQLKAVTVSLSDLMDCEQIANGTYSPLTGFMDRETLMAVLANNRLCDETAWTMPILLQLSPDDVDGFGAGDRIALKHPDGDVHAVMDVSEVYRLDMADVAEKWFGTSSKDHPGVSRFFNGGEVAVAGAVTLVKPVSSSFRSYELSPASSRFIFSHNGWTRVVGFHTRNVCHRAHEHILFSALERAEADGIYVSPVTGGKKRHDFLPGPVLKSYQVLFNSGDYKGIQRLLGGFRTYSRYAGPREAVFTAICRKNMGCTHFIVGRDHTGVGDFYAPDGNRKLFDQLGDIGITPIFFDPIGYNEKTKTYEPVTSKSDANMISGTQFRNALLAGQRVPEWFVRNAIQDMLLDDLAAGRPVFQD